MESTAEAGNGLYSYTNLFDRFEYVGDNEDLNLKVMYLLQDSIT